MSNVTRLLNGELDQEPSSDESAYCLLPPETGSLGGSRHPCSRLHPPCPDGVGERSKLSGPGPQVTG